MHTESRLLAWMWHICSNKDTYRHLTGPAIIESIHKDILLKILFITISVQKCILNLKQTMFSVKTLWMAIYSIVGKIYVRCLYIGQILSGWCICFRVNLLNWHYSRLFKSVILFVYTLYLMYVCIYILISLDRFIKVHICVFGIGGGGGHPIATGTRRVIKILNLTILTIKLLIHITIVVQWTCHYNKSGILHIKELHAYNYEEQRDSVPFPICLFSMFYRYMRKSMTCSVVGGCIKTLVF